MHVVNSKLEKTSFQLPVYPIHLDRDLFRFPVSAQARY